MGIAMRTKNRGSGAARNGGGLVAAAVLTLLAWMAVPAAVNGTWAREHVRTVDLFPTILQALGKPLPSTIDGEPIAISRP